MCWNYQIVLCVSLSIEEMLKPNGGIVIVYKRYLLKSLTCISESEFVQWVRISKDIFTIDSDLCLGCIYISPENSKYSSLEAFNEIESDLIQLSSGCDYFSLIGDFNAKTGDTQHYISKDEKLAEYLDVYDDLDFLNYMDIFLYIGESRCSCLEDTLVVLQI
jgi:hypothetical protein